MQGPAPGTLSVHHSSAANPTWPGGTPPAYPMDRDVAQQGTDWAPPHPVVPVALVRSPPASWEGAQAAVRFHPLALGTVTEVDGTVFSWHSGPHDLPQNPTPANRPAAVTPSLTRSKAEACKRSPTTSVTHHPQGNRHNPLESYLEASSPTSPKPWGTSRGAGALRRSCSSPRLAKGGLSRALLLLGPPDTSLAAGGAQQHHPNTRAGLHLPVMAPCLPGTPLCPIPCPCSPGEPPVPPSWCPLVHSPRLARHSGAQFLSLPAEEPLN